MLSQRRTLYSYVAKRLLQAIPLLFVIVILNFILIHVAPGDPAIFLAGMEATPEYVEWLRAELGLDKALHVQLINYVNQILHLNFGYSFTYKMDVFTLIIDRMWATLLLLGTGLVIASALGIVLGVISSKKPYSLRDNTVTLLALVGYSVPIFWLAQLLILAFSIYLPLFPSQGMTSLRVEYSGLPHLLDVLHHLVLPVIAVVTVQLGLITRLTRASMLEVLSEDFITAARAKGLTERTITYKYALKNALIPVVTVIGKNFAFLLAGGVLTETTFAWPGMGRLMFNAILSRDYPVLIGTFIVVSAMVIITNLVVDILYAYVDPRIRYR